MPTWSQRRRIRRYVRVRQACVDCGLLARWNRRRCRACAWKDAAAWALTILVALALGAVLVLGWLYGGWWGDLLWWGLALGAPPRSD